MLKAVLYMLSKLLFAPYERPPYGQAAIRIRSVDSQHCGRFMSIFTKQLGQAGDQHRH